MLKLFVQAFFITIKRVVGRIMAEKILSIDFHEAQLINPSFLFIVHNDIELNEMLNALDGLVEYNNCVLKIVLDDQPFYIGKFGAQAVILVKTSDMGSTKPFASLNTTTISLSSWQPTYIIMLGVMAGFKKDMEIGDVIIARISIDYQNYKIKKRKFISRAHFYDSGTVYKLFDNITKQALKDHGLSFNIHKGQALSGDVLVDSAPFKSALLGQYPEAKGLEMEFRGVASACRSADVSNILMVKGVCDRGEDKNDEYQKTAMQNAIELCRIVFDDRRNFDKRKLKHSYSAIVGRSVFISGSHDSAIIERDAIGSGVTKKFIDCKEAKTFAMELSAAFKEKGFRIVTGYGREIGDAVVAGVLSNLNIQDSSYTLLSENLLSMPFPRMKDIGYNGYSYEQFKSKYRTIMCKEAAFAVSIFGLKKEEESKKVVPADGVMEELMVAHNLGRMIIPVGATEFMSRKIWSKVGAELGKYYPLGPSSGESDMRLKQRVALRQQHFERIGRKINFGDEKERADLIKDILEFIKKPWEKD